MTVEYSKISITANNQDTESWRNVRLGGVIGYLSALSTENCHPLSKIIALHDHKGFLQVTWSTKPSQDDETLVRNAWLSEIGDRSDNVEHNIS
jgi:hypothetical protein